MPWADQLITYRTGKTKAKAGKGQFFDLAARLRAARFDLAILLPNSFKTALVCKMAGIRRVVGYERDGRGFLLTDKLLPVKERGKFIPTPIIKYYLGLAHYLGSKQPRPAHAAFRHRDRAPRGPRGPRALRPRRRRRTGPLAGGGPPMVLLNPGANYGAAKCWLPEYFAAVGRPLHRRARRDGADQRGPQGAAASSTPSSGS